MAYSVSRIVAEKTDKHTDRLLFYGEPTPESIGPLRGFLDNGGTFQKMIFMTSEEHLNEVRPLAIAALEDSATLTTALPGMLEVRSWCRLGLHMFSQKCCCWEMLSTPSYVVSIIPVSVLVAQEPTFVGLHGCMQIGCSRIFERG